MTGPWRILVALLVAVAAIAVAALIISGIALEARHAAHEGIPGEIPPGQTTCNLCWTIGPGPAMICWRSHSVEQCVTTDPNNLAAAKRAGA